MDQEFDITAEVGGNFTPAPAGKHRARCVGVYVVGTVQNNFKKEGQVIEKRDKMIYLEFELVNTSHVFNEEKGPEPFVLREKFLFSMNTKSNLRKQVNSWFSTKLTDDQAKNVKFQKFLGRQAMVTVVHTPSKKPGSTDLFVGIHQIDDVERNPETKEVLMETAPAKTTPKLFAWGPVFNEAEFEKLPKGIKKVIQGSDEYKKLVGPSAQTNTNGTGFENAKPGATVKGDDLPF